MQFVLLGFAGPDGEPKRTIHRTSHLADLEPLAQQGRCRVGWPVTDKAGSLIAIGADSLGKAQAVAAADPSTVPGSPPVRKTTRSRRTSPTRTL